MTIETCENTSIAATIIMICLFIVVASLGGCYMTEKTNQKAIDAGLVQKSQLGTSTVIWTTP